MIGYFLVLGMPNAIRSVRLDSHADGGVSVVENTTPVRLVTDGTRVVVGDADDLRPFGVVVKCHEKPPFLAFASLGVKRRLLAR